ncbi:MAG: GNAT family N-acetyltransferase [Desulfobacterales bacterium]|jgi:CelD/BcsL family acetyltransferase involved in cellulose biosynthesis
MTPDNPSKIVVTDESFDTLHRYWEEGTGSLVWSSPFSLPFWMAAWHDTFGAKSRLCLKAIWSEDRLIGAAPLMVAGGVGKLVGDPEVCDYLDFAFHPDHSALFLHALIDHLQEDGVHHLSLTPLREGSPSALHLEMLMTAKQTPFEVTSQGSSAEMALPNDWNAFLDGLTGKERHEIRRKFRRLNEAGNVAFTCCRDPETTEWGMDRFMAIFRAGRPDKIDFMTPSMESFFRRLAMAAAAAGLLRLFLLSIDRNPAAAVLCFDYGDTRYLYNNGYDNRYRGLSVGLLSKVATIRDAIESGRLRYDFLKGNEPYKRRLGGRRVRLCGLELPLASVVVGHDSAGGP